jgi:TusE/DsrC/DsvC family sulfur relay protein
MRTKVIAGVPVNLDDDGFFMEPQAWTEAMLPELAAAEGIDELTEDHMLVIKLMRVEYEEKGTGPAVRALSRASGTCIKDLYRLFPKGPAKIAARIAGIPKPRGCI